MDTPIPIYISGLFFLLTIVLAGLFYKAISYASGHLKNVNQRHLPRKVLAGLVIWLGLLGLAAAVGVFADFEKKPPLILFVPFSMLTVVAIFARSALSLQMIKAIPHTWLIFPQVFRIVMEIILWLLFIHHAWAKQLTFEGYNFDILAGITAPIFSYFILKKKADAMSRAIIWNFFGLFLLTTIVTMAIGSAPVPFRFLMFEPANTVIARFPFIWLPGFVVPFAYLLHFLSLRKLFYDRKNHPNEASISK